MCPTPRHHHDVLWCFLALYFTTCSASFFRLFVCRTTSCCIGESEYLCVSSFLLLQIFHIFRQGKLTVSLDIQQLFNSFLSLGLFILLNKNSSTMPTINIYIPGNTNAPAECCVTSDCWRIFSIFQGTSSRSFCCRTLYWRIKQRCANK